MKVLVDTCIWSLALRRKSPSIRSPVKELISLIEDHRVQMIGPIRQEILSGIRHKNQFKKISQQLNAFPDMILETEDYETAAEFYNSCRSKGIQGSNTDFLICAIASRRKLAIYTSDQDFKRFKKCFPIHLHTTA